MKFTQTWQARNITKAADDWFSASVPGNLQYDYGKHHGFADVQYSDNFKQYLPIEDDTWEYKTVLSYERDEGERVFFVSGGIDYRYDIALNGNVIYEYEGMFKSIELDLTDKLTDSENVLTVKVYPHPKRKDAKPGTRDEADHSAKPPVSYGWDWNPRLLISGIWQDTYIETRGEGFISNADVIATLSEDLSLGTVNFSYESTLPTTHYLYDEDGNAVASSSEKTLTVNAPELWWCNGQGKPYLYKWKIENEKHSEEGYIGFKTISLVRNANANGNDSFPKGPYESPITILLNGRRIFAKGSNWVNPDIFWGNITKERYEELISYAKDANMNIFRMWGGAAVEKNVFYDLCDRYGIYVIAEANVESHGMGLKPDTALGFRPEWEKTVVERNVNHVRNYANHACVTMWSLGNESGGGPAFAKAAAAVRGLDPTRPIHYEQDNAIADVDSAMYMSVPSLYERGELGDGTRRAMSDTYRYPEGHQTPLKPFFLCEYAHAMGNAMGNFREYWEAFHSSESLCGGCVWDWIDQSLVKVTERLDPSGRRIRHLAYGGDWDDIPNMGPVCQNGIVGADRKETPKYLEAKQVMRPLVIGGIDPNSGDLSVWNRNAFTPADRYRGRWNLRADGIKVADGTFEVPPIPPMSDGLMCIPDIPPADDPSVEYMLEIVFELAEDALWAKKGHVVGRDEIEVQAGDLSRWSRAGKAVAAIVETGDSFVLEAGGTVAAISKATGTLRSLKMGGVSVLDDASVDGIVSGPRLTCVRAFTDNDTGGGKHNTIRDAFYASGLSQMRHFPVKTERDGDSLVSVVRAEGTRACGWLHERRWSVSADGTLSVENRIVPHGKMPELPRLGTSWILDPALTNVTWYGRGPHENYPDRASSAFLGVYSSSVSDLYVPYARPQDNGVRSDVRWVEFADANGRGVRFSASVPLCVRALHHSWEDLEFSRHRRRQERIFNVKPPRREVCLDLDIAERGLGNASCGPKTLPEYCIGNRVREWRETVRPLRARP